MSPYIAFFLPALTCYGTYAMWPGAYGGLAFVYAAIVFIFGAIPLADWVASRGTKDGARAATVRPISEVLIVAMSLPLQIGNIFFFAWYVTTHDLNGYEAAALLFIAGIFSALYAQNPAHELIHHRNRLERVIGILLFSTSLYSGAKLAHVHSHHLLVATDRDPTSAKYGQSLYGFLPKAIAVNLFGWWGRKGDGFVKVPLFQRRIVWENLFGYAMSAIWAALIFSLFGAVGLVFFLLQSMIGILVLEMMNYIGHYGLERRVDAAGQMETVTACHAWDCDLPFSNLVLISVQKHADHHVNPNKPYGELQCLPDSPRLPLSYPLLFILTLMPGLWRRLIHPRLDAYRAAHGRDDNRSGGGSPSSTPVELSFASPELDFGRCDPARWNGGSVVKSHFWNTMSSLLPNIEFCAIRSLMPLASQIHDGKLQREVRQFCDQEANHGTVHSRFNRECLHLAYPALASMEDWERKVFSFFSRVLPQNLFLSLFVAVEHWTAAFAQYGLDNIDEWFPDCDPVMLKLWEWHAVEELAHKSVCFDIYRYLGGRYFGMVIGMFILLGTVMLPGIILRLGYLLWKDAPLLKLSTYASLLSYLFGWHGIFTRTTSDFLKYFSPSYKPWDVDSLPLINAYLQKEQAEPAL
ncbi:metal-dependent hydrolase [Jeongeupia naejangsanensis]|uniref:Metal-dependent hydrolase n=1 Tax=Jeongeupia naejangsanensis TaxID=613195 RepID=A0ABS2BN56_9NEIS|nr:metal-dependent hydrolase [Jeongeupia naejangsanensis]MBM3117046.1 metal-dependent hydrolase [Jeongeupia naejangsanensis]